MKLTDYNDPIKNAYKDLWKPGNEREEMIKGLLESWGFEVKPFGFMALSDEYNPEWSEEQGVPDLVIENRIGQQIFIEVTGTDNIRDWKKVWIREHKIDWAKKNPDKQSFCAHVITQSKLVRFVDMTNMELDFVPKGMRVLHGIETDFYLIPHDVVIPSHKMKNRLMAWRDRL